MSILDNLIHTCTIQIRSRTQDSVGGDVDSWSDVFTNVKCWRQPVSEKEIFEYRRAGMSVTDKFYFTFDYRVDEGYRIVIDNEEWEVRARGVPDRSAGKGIVWRVLAEIKTTDNPRHLR